MISRKKRKANRANGALSRGPVTAEGKKRSSMNALKHGILAQNVIVGRESEEAFNTVLTEHLLALAPRDGVERAMVDEMVGAKWRQLRSIAIEDEWLEQELDGQSQDHERARIAGAFGSLQDKGRVA